MIEFLFCLLAVTIALPFLVFLCAKLGMYGALKGKQLFERDNHISKGDNVNGDSERQG